MPAVTVISAAVLHTGRQVLGEAFAARAGAALDLATGVEAGTRTLWDAPGPPVNALAHALGPDLGEMLWTATVCDLLLANVLGGDHEGAGIVATDVLRSPAQ